MTKEQGTLFDDLPEPIGPVHRHPVYPVWANMVQRCHNPNNKGYANYGARGIFVCDEWRASSRAFIAWAIKAGWQAGLELDRENNDGPYSPANCRFVTRLQNANNKRNNVRLSDGTTVPEVSRQLGVKLDTLHMRIHRGMSPDEAAARPLGLPGEHMRRHFLPDGTALVDAARVLGMSAHAVRARLSRGWSIADAVSVPKGGKRPRLDAPAVSGDDASIPAMAPVGDVMPRNLSAACDLRAAFAHHKGNRHG